jgi:hypothetical protein
LAGTEFVNHRIQESPSQLQRLDPHQGPRPRGARCQTA